MHVDVNFDNQNWDFVWPQMELAFWYFCSCFPKVAISVYVYAAFADTFLLLVLSSSLVGPETVLIFLSIFVVLHIFLANFPSFIALFRAVFLFSDS